MKKDLDDSIQTLCNEVVMLIEAFNDESVRQAWPKLGRLIGERLIIDAVTIKMEIDRKIRSRDTGDIDELLDEVFGADSRKDPRA